MKRRHVILLTGLVGVPALGAAVMHARVAKVHQDDLQEIRKQVAAQLPQARHLRPAPDAQWFGMDLRMVPVNRVQQIILPYTGPAPDTTVDHGDTVAPGVLPRAPQAPGSFDPEGYKLGAIDAWDTVFYSLAGGESGGVVGRRGPALMLNGTNVSAGHADEMVRQTAADVMKRFHLPARFAPQRNRWGELTMSIKFTRTKGAANPYSPDIQGIYLQSWRSGHAFMAIVMDPA